MQRSQKADLLSCIVGILLYSLGYYMTYLLRVGVLSTVLLASSCSVIEREAGYPGGNLGYASDRKILFAQGHDQRVQRYLVTLALLSPLIAETAETPIEAKLSSERIDAIYEKLGALRKAAENCRLARNPEEPNYLNLGLEGCDVDENGVGENALAFETISFDVAKSLNNALKQAYDNLNLRKRVSNITALAPSEILKTVLRARHLLPVAMKYFGTYRDVTAILSASVLESCVIEKRAYDEADKLDKWRSSDECQKTGDLVTNYLQRSRTVDSDIARQEKPIREIYNASRDAINSGLDWKFTKKHVAALIFHVDRTCLKLVKLQEIEGSTDVTDCQLSGSKNAKAFYADYKN